MWGSNTVPSSICNTPRQPHARVQPSPVAGHQSVQPVVPSPQVRRRLAAARTLAPDRSQVTTQLDKLLRMSDSSADPALAPQVRHTRPALTSLRPRPSPGAATPMGQAALEQSSELPEPMRSVDGDDYHPSDGWRPRSHHLRQTALWQRIRDEAHVDASMEPALATFLHSVVLSHNSMEGAMAFLLANKLADNVMLGAVQLMSLLREAYASEPDIMAAGIADLHAVMDRDPACAKFSQCMLHFKGYQAIQCYRITHWLWQQGRQSLAMAIQSRVSMNFAVDIHPAATIGRGVMFDHATGIVIGETAVVGDNVSMLHHVSLGGSGTGTGVRHPHICHGVLLGAGATVLGPVTVGAGCKVGAGSVVVTDLPPFSVAVGVPAAIVRRNLRSEPIKEMDQCADFILDYVI